MRAMRVKPGFLIKTKTGMVLKVSDIITNGFTAINQTADCSNWTIECSYTPFGGCLKMVTKDMIGGTCITAHFDLPAHMDIDHVITKSIEEADAIMESLQ